MRTLPALAAGLTAAVALTVAVAAGVAADDDPRSERLPAAPVSAVVEDEGPGTETVPSAREDEGPGTETVPGEPRYDCVDGVCDTYGESTEGPGTDG